MGKSLKVLWGMPAWILVVVFLAWLFPQWADVLHKLQMLAVMIVFFLQGLILPSEELRRGVAAWQTHLVIQCGVFIGFPLLVLAVLFAAGSSLDPSLRMGFVYLAVLPTTVATASAYTSQSGGNAAVAIFNIVLSNMVGILIASAVLVWLLKLSEGVNIPLVDLIQNLVVAMILPFIAGQVMHRYWSFGKTEKAARHGKCINNAMILLIVYLALCRLNHELSQGLIAMEILGQAAFISVVILVLVRLCALVLLRWVDDKRLRRAVYFCVCQKTLAVGLPLAMAVFAAAGMEVEVAALVMLPIIIYHCLQMIVDAYVAAYWAG